MGITFSSSGFIQRASTTILDANGSMGVWFRRSGRPSGVQPWVMGRGSSISSAEGWGFYLENTAGADQDKLFFFAKSATQVQRITLKSVAQTVFDGNWHCASCDVRVENAATCNLFYDGVKSTGTNSASWDMANQPVRFAKHVDTFWGAFDGSLSGAFWYNEVLTEMEHFLLSRGVCPLLIRPQNLVLYIPMADETQVFDWGKSALALTTGGTLSRATFSPPIDYTECGQLFDVERNAIIAPFARPHYSAYRTARF